MIVIYDINIWLLITLSLRQRLSRFIGTVLSVGSAGLGFAMIRPCTAKKDKYIYGAPPGVKARTLAVIVTNDADKLELLV
jgi:hypothetical protein